MATAALVVTAVTAVKAVASIFEQRKDGKEQRKQIEKQNHIEATKRVRNIKRAVASARVRRAEVQAAGFQLGVAGGTAAQGAAAGVTGELASVIGASNIQFTGQQAIAASQTRISQFQQSASTFGAISSLAGQFDEQSIASIQALAGG